MRVPIGDCLQNCPVIALLEGREGSDEQANMHDGLMAERLSSRPHVKDELMESCPLGGPHKPFLSFGKVACSAEYMIDPGEPRSSYIEAEA
jgi:hypothetical protein